MGRELCGGRSRDHASGRSSRGGQGHGRQCAMKSEWRRTGMGLVEISHDGRTVWVNTEEANIGRFGVYGIDVHNTISAQRNGAPECLACTHEKTHLPEWRRFQLLMLEH